MIVDASREVLVMTRPTGGARRLDIETASS